MATVEDLLRVQGSDGRHYELVDRTLVEKAMRWLQSLLAGVLIQCLRNFLDQNNLGVITGADGMSRLFGDTIRCPDVAFISWARLPDGRIPKEPIPNIVPDFVVEVLSDGNTRSEMARKRREYFAAGVRLIWMVDPRDRTVAVYRDPESVTVVDDSGVLDGADVLPSFTLGLAQLFSHLDQRAPDAR
jgi:Uma2 family endonuclease